MSGQRPRFLKTIVGDDQPLERYPGLPPPTVQEPPVSIFSRSAGATNLVSPTKRTRAGDVKPRAKRSKVSQGSKNGGRKNIEPAKETSGLEWSASPWVNTHQVQTPPETDPFPFTAPLEESSDFSVQEGLQDPNILAPEYAEFVEAVRGGSATFDQFARNLCVVQGWDARRSQTTSHWYHLQFVDVSGHLKIACQCPINHCFHKTFLREYYHEEFSEALESVARMSYAADVPVVMFSRERIVDEVHRSIFSVTTNSATTPMNRAIVMYEGIDAASGRWTCTKDSREQIMRSGFCTHIAKSRKELARHLNVDLGELDDDSSVHFSREPIVRKIKEKPAVSYLPILCPKWAELPTDTALYARPRPIWELPAGYIFPISATSSCICSGGTRSFYDESKPTVLHNATLYTLVSSSPVVSNSNPAQTALPPAGTTLGLTFTPFERAGLPTRHSRNSKMTSCVRTVAPFPTPNIVWDGVSLSFNRGQLSGLLEPPTNKSTSSPVRPKTKYLPKQQAIPKPSLRKMLRKIITMEGLEAVANKASSSKDSPRKSTVSAPQQAINAVSDHLDNIILVRDQLEMHNVQLASLFDRHFGITAYHTGLKPPVVITRFFRQIAAEESVMQMVNREALRALSNFLESPTPTGAPSLIIIPHIHALLQYDYCRQELQGYSSSILSICAWIRDRAREVLNALLANAGPGVDRDAEQVMDADWKTTGCFYSLPKIRERPLYPLLSHEQQDDANKTSTEELNDTALALCGKFFSSYSQRRMTGGIMAAWCTHTVCYGFHFMPGYEGRNDPFSAMITRWPKAPKRVIYDFSCALGPYCLLREPDFFADTLFIIDNFHSRDHTKCAPACFASTYAHLDPEVSDINTSAAESGNSLILRIRKALPRPLLSIYGHYIVMQAFHTALSPRPRNRPHIPRNKSSDNLAALASSQSLPPRNISNEDHIPRLFNKPTKLTLSPTGKSSDASSAKSASDEPSLISQHQLTVDTSDDDDWLNDSSSFIDLSPPPSPQWVGITWSTGTRLPDKPEDWSEDSDFVTVPSLVHSNLPAELVNSPPLDGPTFTLAHPMDLWELSLEDDIVVLPPTPALPCWEIMSVSDALALTKAGLSDTTPSPSSRRQGSMFFIGEPQVPRFNVQISPPGMMAASEETFGFVTRGSDFLSFPGLSETADDSLGPSTRSESG
ncbi:hypothetical protein NP233_g8383 [Leucocoprinus birnbaumii]|uniref:Uncharacterized protein n=1 Tax=Leucocoprinus birnbaumii TaxID=56174 RepID=A0AAD5VN71_9AGAR|nr:hypothetical protein NP233_g8383 [Leucocoprinus birnbaumii]